MIAGRMTLKAYRAAQPKRAPLNPVDEARLRARVADMLKAELPPGVIWTSLPPDAPGGPSARGGRAASAGCPGWPDLLFVLPGGRLGGIEITAGRGPSESRRRWRADAAAAGALWAECRTAGGVRETLRGWGVAMPRAPR